MSTPDGLTGGPRRLLTLAKALGGMGVQVGVATQGGSVLIKAAAEEGHCTVRVDEAGVLALRQGALFRGNAWFRGRIILTLFRQNLRFWRCVHRHDADAVWIRSSKGIALAAVGTVLSRRPLIWDVDYEPPSRGVVRWLHQLGLWSAETVIFQYEAAADSIFGKKTADRYRGKFQTIIPGIGLDRLDSHAINHRQKNRRPSGAFQILQVGSICDRKNQRLIIEALRLLGDDIPKDLHVQFAGSVFEEDYSAELQHDARDYGVEDKVEFLGWRDDVYKLMAEADLLVMPSKDEGVPNTVQEAMYLGLPVIVSGAGGMPEIVRDSETGWVLSHDDPAAWAERIRECAERADLGEAIGAAAAQYAAEHFGTGGWAARYSASITNAVTARARGTRDKKIARPGRDKA